MLLILLGTVIFLLFLTFQYKWSKVKRYWAVRGVPYSPPHPILGGLQFLLKENAGDWLIAKYKEHKPNPYFGTWWLWRPSLIVCDPDLAKRILVTDFSIFADRMANCAEKDKLGGQNIFFLNEPKWSKIRKRLTPVFSSAKLKSIDPLKLEKSKELVQRIQNDIAGGRNIDLRETFVDFTTDVIAAAAFGVADSATLNGHSAMRKITHEFMDFTWFRAAVWGSIFFFPEVVNFFGFTFFPKTATDYFRKVFDKAVEQRGGWHRKNNQIRDLLDALINMKIEAEENGEDIDKEVILAQAAIFLQGGFETTAMSMLYIVYELAYNEIAQKRLYEEVRKAKEKLNGKDFDFESLSKLTYLQCVIKEGLRKYPVIGFLDRVACEDYRFDEKLTIEKGTSVFVNIIGMQYDPVYFPDPNKFEPDRFLPENDATLKPFAYLPFGEGPRHCIGFRFGRHTVAYAVAYLVLAFEFQPYPGMVKPEHLKKDKNTTITIPEQPVHVKFVPRK